MVMYFIWRLILTVSFLLMVFGAYVTCLAAAGDVSFSPLFN